MNPKVLSRLLALCLLALALGLALACGSSSYSRAMYYMDKRQWDQAADQLDKAFKEAPHNLKYEEALVRARLKASQGHMDMAQMSLAREDYAATALHLEKALHYDPSNQYAKDQMQKVLALAAAKEAGERQKATSLEEMKEDSRDDMGVPRLDPASNIPIVLKFTDTSAKTILDAISKASGINFLYDEKADVSKRLTVDFAKVNLSQVLDYLMMQTKSFYKVLDPHTLIIVGDNKQKRDEYTDQVIRTFYLSNADAKDVFQLVRSILQARKMAMNQDLNSITIQDSPEIVAICQQIIMENDKSKGEVAVDVELLEVDSGLTRQLGLNLAPRSFTIGSQNNLTTDSSGNVTGINPGGGPPVPLNKVWDTITHGLFIAPVPNITLDLLLDSANAQILARPQLRVMEGQKAMVHIGQKYPIPTANMYNPTGGTVGQSYQPVTSYTYQDIGVKIEIEPKVHHNHEITIKLKVDVSAIAGSVGGGSPNNPTQPIIGTRESNSVIRLEDGETSMMAGLIQEDERHTLNGVPGLSEIPILRRLFSTNKDEKTKTDVVMLLTPHIIRMPNITESDLKPVWVGTADNPKLRGDSLQWAPSPFAAGKADKSKAEAKPVPAVPGAITPAPSAPSAVPPNPASGAPALKTTPPAPAAAATPPPARPAPPPTTVSAGPAGTVATLEPGVTVAIMPVTKDTVPPRLDESTQPPAPSPPSGGTVAQPAAPATQETAAPHLDEATQPPAPQAAATPPPTVAPAPAPAPPAPAPVAPAPAPVVSAPAPTPPASGASAATSPAPAARLMLSPSTQVVDPGQLGVLNLVLVGAQDYKGLRLNVEFPAELIKFQGAEEGTFFKMGGGKTTFTAKETSPGHLGIEIVRADGASSGSGLAVRVKFTATKAGEATVSFGNVSATNMSGQSAELTSASGVIQVPAGTPPQAAPAPAGAQPPPPAPSKPPAAGG